jgi:tetratricopeptide (TPR) repeat protein
LIRTHYLARLKEKPSEARQAIHRQIKDWYLASSGETPTLPTLEQLTPLIEAVHHACQAGEYDSAFNDIAWERIYQRTSHVIIHKLGAYETNLALMQEFFLQGDTAQDSQVSKPGDKAFILNVIALSLMSLGRLREAPPFYDRATKNCLDQSDWSNASVGYQNLAGLYVYLGELPASADAAREAIDLSNRADDQGDKRDSLTYLAYAAFLQGDIAVSGDAFQQAEALERAIDSSEKCLYGLRGIQHTEYLLRSGDADYAQRVAAANLESCQSYSWLDSISGSHRVLGDLGIKPQFQYAEALKIARSISNRNVLIEALLGYGRWLLGLALLPPAANTPGMSRILTVRPEADSPSSAAIDLPLAHQYLEEALNYATTSGYRRYEADLRIALAWLHLREDNPTAARREAERAKKMSVEMGYAWGQVDANVVLERIPSAPPLSGHCSPD